MHKIIGKLFRNIVSRHFKFTVVLLSLITAILYFILGVWIFNFLPGDYLQGELVKIMYIHVPCAWLSLASYICLGVFSIIYLMYHSPICSIASNVTTVISLNACLITLITGAIWGKAAWGTWWIWDARLTAVFMQFCLLSVCYLMRSTVESHHSTIEQSTALLTIIGLINIPIIKFSVNAWNSIHQNASVMRFDGSKIHSDFLMPLIISFVAISCFYITAGIVMARIQLQRQKNYSSL